MILFCRVLETKDCHCVSLGFGLLPASPPDCFCIKSEENIKKEPLKKLFCSFCPIADMIPMNSSILTRNHDVLLVGKTDPFLRCVREMLVK